MEEDSQIQDIEDKQENVEPNEQQSYEDKEGEVPQLEVKPVMMNYLKQQELLQSQLDKEVFHEERQSKPKGQVKSEKIFVYFCSICGKKSIMANVGLDSLPNRRTDNSIAVNMQQIFLQTFLVPDGLKYIKRQNNIERQYRWKCEECGVFIAYQCINYEESAQIFHVQESQLSNRPYLYVLNDALVINQQFSKLYQEVARLKDQLVPS